MTPVSTTAGDAPPDDPAATAPSVQETAASATVLPRRRRLWLGLPGLVFQFLLLPLLLLALMLGTQQGLRTAVTLAEDLLPGMVSIDQIDGRILGTLHLRGLRLHLPSGLALSLGECDLDWSPAQLLSGVLAIQRLALRDLDLVLPPGSAESSPLTLPAIHLPLSLELGEAVLEHLRILQTETREPVFVLDTASLSATLLGSELRLKRLTAQLPNPSLTASAQGQVNLTDDYPLNLTLDWRLTTLPAAQMSGAAQFSGDLQRLTVAVQLAGAVEGTLSAQLQDILQQPRWDGQVELSRVDLPAFRSDLPELDASASLATHGTRDDLTFTGNIAAAVPDRPDLGHLTLELALSGRPAALDYRLLAAIPDALLSPVSLTLNGRLTETAGQRQAEVTALHLDALDGQLDAQAKVKLTPRLAWDAHLTLTDINPGVIAPEWPGRLAGQLNSQGTLGADGLTLTAVIEKLTGTLRNNPVAAAGALVMTGQTLRLTGLRAESGSSRARVDGVINDALDLAFALDSPDLATLLPQAKGRLTASGTLQGSRKTPRINLKLDARDAAVAGQWIERLSGTADVDLAMPGRFAIQLDGKNLATGEMRWTALTVRGDGTMPEHRLTATLTGEPLAVKLAATGQLATDGHYQGRVTTLDLETAQSGVWRLQRPLLLNLAQPRIAVGPVCIRHAQGAGGCLSFEQTAPGDWNASADLDKLDFSLLSGWFPKRLSAEGAAQITARFQGKQAVLSGTATAAIPKGRLLIRPDRGQPEIIDLSQTRLTLDANGRALSAALSLPLHDLGRISASLSLPGWRLDAPARPGQPLTGRIQAEIPGLARFAHLVPDLSRLTGRLDADVTLGGTLAKPGVSGQVGIRNVNLKVPLIAMTVQNFNLTAHASTPERLELIGTASIGGGRLDVSGDSRISADGFSARVQISGERLKVANTKEYFAIVSPRIALEATAQGAVVRGEIRVPEARIRPRKIPAGTVSPSPDVIVQTAGSASGQPRPIYPVALDLRLLLGDEVSLDAFGVTGRLAGNLAVTQAPGKELLGDGQLQIRDGQYRFSGGFGVVAELGAPLTITQGRLVFAKTPVGNPGLLLQAEREGSSTSAGVRVLGTLRRPKLAFFSESDPNLTQAEITKYLMTGIPPTGSSQANATGLAVGTYIAPKTYLEYETGLGSTGNAVKLRYELSRHIELQTETGEQQGGDIYFKFEN